MKLLHRSVAAALLAPMLVLAISAGSLVGLRCRMTGRVTLVTCCPAPDGVDGEVGAGFDASAAADGSVSEPGCCERIVVANAKPPAAGGMAPEQSAPLPVAAALPVPALRRPASRVAPGVFDVDPPDPFRPPLRVLNRSLLI